MDEVLEISDRRVTQESAAHTGVHGDVHIHLAAEAMAQSAADIAAALEAALVPCTRKRRLEVCRSYAALQLGREASGGLAPACALRKPARRTLCR
ncbi:hypothetical protein [Streptomyces aureocirculatus]|uniref:hypothetical protein n=1 Tax=Streptomyces aureocirculatus TaxID=67275 RepID=UPI0004C4A865|nr:hypothetical protein [Streptomyces aureocirculatus]